MPEQFSSYSADSSATPQGAQSVLWPFNECTAVGQDHQIVAGVDGITTDAANNFWTHLDIECHQTSNNALLSTVRVRLQDVFDVSENDVTRVFTGLTNGLSYTVRARAVRVTP